MYNILHITTHMGGGVGKALSDICVNQNMEGEFFNKIIILDKPEKKYFIDKCIRNNVEVLLYRDINIEKEVKNADIVVINWWHNPLMYKLLMNFPKIDTRVVVWNHVSGCNYPMLPFSLVKMVNNVFLTTKYTLDNPYWTFEEREYVKKNSTIVYGMGSNKYIDRKIKKTISNSFNIGYVGTIDKSKINENFVKYCKEVIDIIPNAYFIMVGDFDPNNSIYKEVLQSGMKNRFEFVGYTDDVVNEFARFDVLGYPLNNYHFGATENVLLEAMALKIPIVALNQCTEKYIIKNMQTGLLAENEKDYAKKMKYLASNKNERIRIGENARKYVIDMFSMKDNIKRMEEAYIRILHDSKSKFEFSRVFGDKPYEWFLSCLGNDREMFEESLKHNYKNNEKEIVEKKIKNCREILRGKSKSSIYQFFINYPYDNNLKYWYSLIKEK